MLSSGTVLDVKIISTKYPQPPHKDTLLVLLIFKLR